MHADLLKGQLIPVKVTPKIIVTKVISKGKENLLYFSSLFTVYMTAPWLNPQKDFGPAMLGVAAPACWIFCHLVEATAPH